MINAKRLDEMAELRRRCEEYLLCDRSILVKYSNEQLAGIYNGCGPERWPNWVREKIDRFTWLFAPVILIHDIEFHETDGTDIMFDSVCEAFRENIEIILDAEYPLWTWNMLKPTYRAERSYWLTVGGLLMTAVSTGIARREYKRQYKEA